MTYYIEKRKRKNHQCKINFIRFTQSLKSDLTTKMRPHQNRNVSRQMTTWKSAVSQNNRSRWRLYFLCFAVVSENLSDTTTVRHHHTSQSRDLHFAIKSFRIIWLFTLRHVSRGWKEKRLEVIRSRKWAEKHFFCYLIIHSSSRHRLDCRRMVNTQ